MKPTSILISVILVLFSIHLNAQMIIINGNVQILNDSSHSDISVFFHRTVPSSLNYTFTSDLKGDYSGEIEQGFYDIEFLASGSFAHTLKDIQLYDNSTISSVVLQKVTNCIKVPESFPTIQEAIDVANQGDTVLIAPGVYYENLILVNKPVLLASQYIFTGDTTDISNTIIDGSNSGSVVSMAGATESPTTFKGLSIRNGNAVDIEIDPYPYQSGGGIYCWEGNLSIDHCKVYSNRSESGNGGGIYFWGNILNIDNTEIYSNYAEGGGGLSFSAFSATVNNTMIYDNISTYSGGGMSIDAYSALNIFNCNVCNNTVQSGGTRGAGIDVFNRKSFFIIANSIIANNVGGEGINCFQGEEYPQITNCNVWNNSGGNFFNCDPHCGVIVAQNANGDPRDAFNNISIDPDFEDIDNNDFTLRGESPCIDAGNNQYCGDVLDFYFNTRISDGNKDSIAVIDMGPIEYYESINELAGIDGYNTNIQVFPNPCSQTLNFINLELGKTKLQIFDIWGKLVYEAFTESKQSIDMSLLKCGIYILRVTDSKGQVINLKIMKI